MSVKCYSSPATYSAASSTTDSICIRQNCLSGVTSCMSAAHDRSNEFMPGKSTRGVLGTGEVVAFRFRVDLFLLLVGHFPCSNILEVSLEICGSGCWDVEAFLGFLSPSWRVWGLCQFS